MELWIRSQDKSKIVKVNELYSSLQEDFGTGKFGIYSSNANYYQKERPLLLGNYKSKERALMILDEIQNILQPRIIMREPEIDYDDMINSLTDNIMLKTTQKIDMELKEAGQVVYQMPEE